MPCVAFKKESLPCSRLNLRKGDVTYGLYRQLFQVKRPRSPSSPPQPRKLIIKNLSISERRLWEQVKGFGVLAQFSFLLVWVQVLVHWSQPQDSFSTRFGYLTWNQADRPVRTWKQRLRTNRTRVWIPLPFPFLKGWTRAWYHCLIREESNRIKQNGVVNQFCSERARAASVAACRLL